MILAGMMTASGSSGSSHRDGPDSLGESSMRLVAEALSWRSVPYLLGGHGKDGADCSGFVSEALLRAEVGGSIPRSSAAFAQWGQKAAGGARPGDILVFGDGKTASHVGIALSVDRFIHAASEGPRTGVIISDLDESTWRPRLMAVRRPGKGKGKP